MKKELNEKIHFSLTCILALLMPVWPNALPATIALLLLNWIIGKNFLHLFRKEANSYIFFLTISLYILYAIGMLWTKNAIYGWKDLETKLSLFIFPIVFYSSKKFNQDQIKNIFKFFFYGCLIASILCLSHASYQYLHTKYLLSNNRQAWDYGINFFLKSRLSVWIHPSYIAMYFCMAIIGLYWVKAKEEKTLTEKYIIPYILSIFIFLFSSKAGILSLILWGCFIGANIIFVQKKFFQAAIGLIFFVFSFLVLYFSAPQFALRINSTLHTLSENPHTTNSEESTASRIEIWRASKKVITENLLWGAGTGDIKDELFKEYDRRGMTFASQEKLNAHNQFFQTTAALGIIGGILLGVSLLIPLYIEWEHKNYIYVSFILLILVNFIAESMLETQAGVVFYAFINSLLLFAQEKNYDPLLSPKNY
ncbi:MAG TPA: O-antigen ligase family protein [Bacteroidia bacterium]|nr:O-antigen ligase family protein [Bacteroidia bacterium]